MNSEKIEFRPCGVAELEKVLELEKSVLTTLDKEELLRRNKVEMWKNCLQPPHYCLGAWAGKELIALAVLYIPQEGDGEALAPLLQTVHTERHKAAHFKICLVHPNWRGQHLQVTLGAQLHAEAQRHGYNLLCATASPINIASIKNLQRLGYKADHKLRKYGFERILLYCFN